jgi:hypothetical protein
VLPRSKEEPSEPRCAHANETSCLASNGTAFPVSITQIKTKFQIHNAFRLLLHLCLLVSILIDAASGIECHSPP